MNYKVTPEIKSFKILQAERIAWINIQQKIYCKNFNLGCYARRESQIMQKRDNISLWFRRGLIE